MEFDIIFGNNDPKSGFGFFEFAEFEDFSLLVVDVAGESEGGDVDDVDFGVFDAENSGDLGVDSFESRLESVPRRRAVEPGSIITQLG